MMTSRGVTSTRPTISIILATNRICPYLPAALASVARQTCEDWELIVVDDGSPDPGALRELVDAVPDAVLVRQPNRGVAQARNAGCGAATGTYITFLDDDDFWPDDRLELQLQAIRDCGEDVIGCFGRLKYVDEAGNVFGDGPVPDTADAALGAGFHIGTIVVKADAVNRAGLFNPFLRSASDVDFSLRLGHVGALVYVPETLLFYRRHAANMTNDRLAISAYGRAVFEYYHRLATLAGDISTSRAIGDSFASLERYLAVSAARSAKAHLFELDFRGCATNGLAALSSAYTAGRYRSRRSARREQHR